MANIDAFAPGVTTSLTASATSASISIGGGSDEHFVRLYNSGAVTAYINTGDSTVAATVAAGCPMPPGIVEILDLGSDTHLAAITSSGSAILFATVGRGI